MFEKLEKLTKKNGKKFMEMSEAERNSKEYRDAMREVQEQLADYVGADSSNLNLFKKKDTGMSRYVGNHKLNVEIAISIFEATLEMAQVAIEPEVAAAVHAANQTKKPSFDDDGRVSAESVAMGMKEALDGIPVKYKEQVLRKMGKMMGKDFDDDDEDDLLKDLLS